MIKLQNIISRENPRPDSVIDMDSLNGILGLLRVKINMVSDTTRLNWIARHLETVYYVEENGKMHLIIECNDGPMDELTTHKFLCANDLLENDGVFNSFFRNAIDACIKKQQDERRKGQILKELIEEFK